ncbi:ankyrin repeat-containing domain protein [Hypoxylon trugodes]|uniref:ankyrin repeat-containing domain protein n=1 Tax=Hypoxylon trugodes TaxID=326681 RepID=UPI0021A0D320|nr:ankyrin repeat-containing domain protein [Hypoxylon trugodes]KAI1383597.1 ankyrin repeat-containing domain protein [Hypoxylon trugodes]
MAVFDSLSNEVLFIIIDFLPSSRDLATLARTSWRLHLLANPILYGRNRDEENSSAVLWAAQHGRIETLKKAHTFGLDLNPDVSEIIDYESHLAVQRFIPEDVLGVQYFVTVAMSSIILAIDQGHRATVAWLVDHGIEMDFLSQSDLHHPMAYSALLAALILRQASVACLLIEKGACLDFPSSPTGVLEHTGYTDRAFPAPPKPVSALHIAADLGLVSVIEFLVQRGVDINTIDGMGDTCLNYAARSAKEDPRVISELIRFGADVNHNQGDCSPLCDALYMGKLDHALALIDGGSRLDHLTLSDVGPIHLCTWREVEWRYKPGGNEMMGSCGVDPRRSTLLQRFIDLGADVNGMVGQRRTPLGEAILSGSPGTVEMLINAGADVNRDIGDGRLPVRVAWELDEKDDWDNDFEIDALKKIEILLENGARIDSRFGENEDSPSILEHAAKYYAQMVEWRSSEWWWHDLSEDDDDDEDHNYPARKFTTLLHLASIKNMAPEHIDEVLAASVKRQSFRCCKLLLKYGAKLRNGSDDVLAWAMKEIRRQPRCPEMPNEVDTDYLALTYSADFEPLMTMLLDLGLPFKEMDKLFTQALVCRDPRVAHMILDRGITGKGPGHDPNIWLQKAASWGNVGIIRKLLRGSPDVNGFDSKGCLPLTRAIRVRNRLASLLLIEYGADPYLATTIGKGQGTKQTLKPIQHAIRLGRIDILKDILKYRPRALTEEEKWVPAVLRLAPEIAELLERSAS